MHQTTHQPYTYHLSYDTVYEDVYEPSYGVGFIFYDEEELSSDENEGAYFAPSFTFNSFTSNFSGRQKR